MGLFSKLKKALEDVHNDDQTQQVQQINQVKQLQTDENDSGNNDDDDDEDEQTQEVDEEDEDEDIQTQEVDEEDEDEEEDEYVQTQEVDEEEEDEYVETQEVDDEDEDENVQTRGEDEEDEDEDVQTQEVDEDDEGEDVQTQEVDGDDEGDDQSPTVHDVAQDAKQKDMELQIQELRMQLSEKPKSEDVSDQELQDGSVLFMKALIAQVFNQKSAQSEPPISHHDVDHQLVPGDNAQDFNVNITTSDSSGKPYTLVAKLDTGADDNFIKESVVRSHHIAVALLEGPATFSTGGGMANASGIATLHYHAGKDKKLYSQDFNVIPGSWKVDVVLGRPFQQQAHAVMLNPDFAHPTSPPDFLLIEQDTATKEEEVEMDAKVKQRNEEHRAAYLARTGRKDVKKVTTK